MIPAASADFYRSQQHLSVLTVAQVRRSWRRMGGNWEDAWLTVGPQVQVVVMSAQLAAARRAAAYTAAVVHEVGLPDDAEGSLNPASLVGVASDGRPLDSLLYGSVVTTGQAFNKGATEEQALSTGLSWLEGAVQTQIADVGRVGTGVGITARPFAPGYVRMLNPPSCARCAILAGKWFRWNAGFQRHFRCDCIHIVSSEAMRGDLTTEPKAYFKSLDRAEQDRIFTKPGAKAIRDGADPAQVVNARRGMSQGQLLGQDAKFTTSGITRRGSYGSGQTALTKTRGSRYRTAQVPRLMPESIYKFADDRDHAIRLLKKYGYIW